MNEKIVYFYPTTVDSTEPLLQYQINSPIIKELPLKLTSKFKFKNAPSSYRVELKLAGKTFIDKDQVVIKFTGKNRELGNFGSISVDFTLKNVVQDSTAEFEILLFDENSVFLTSAKATLYFVSPDDIANVEIMKEENNG